METRQARFEDRDDLSQLIFSASHVHKHLDWKAPLEWLGSEPFLVVQEGSRLSAALACPPDPAAVAWLRLFVFDPQLDASTAWRMLWPAAREKLISTRCPTAAAIAVQRWLDPILIDNGFQLVDQIVLMELDIGTFNSPTQKREYAIRPMLASDLARVVAVDAAAFEPLWRNSLEALTHALGQAVYATVAEGEGGMLGYQLSTGGAFGTHLARLAVGPPAQRRGLGAALVHDLIAHIPGGRESRLTVNTQSSNAASHALYARCGFRRTGERFPVFAVTLQADSAGQMPRGMRQSGEFQAQQF